MFDHLSFDADIVTQVKFKTGLEHRPIWEVIKRLPPEVAIPWVSRFDYLNGVAAEWALAQVFEQAAGMEVSPGDQQVRTLFAEIHRLVGLTDYMTGILKALGQPSLVEQMSLLREQVWSLCEELTGGRILPQVLTLGGNRRHPTVGDHQKIRGFVRSFRFQWERWSSFFWDDLVESRLDGLMRVPTALVERNAWWGITGKGSGLGFDARKHRPYGAYPWLSWEIPNFSSGDALARVKVACAEIQITLQLIEQVLAIMKLDGSQRSVSKKIEVVDGTYWASTESTRGPFTAMLEIENGQVGAVRIFSSSQRIWPQLGQILSGLRVDDLDLAMASLNVSPADGEV